jgi:hypothetical protein
MLNFNMLNVANNTCMLSVAVQSVATLSVAMLSVAMLNVAMLSVAMLSVAMMIVVMLSVVAPWPESTEVKYLFDGASSLPFLQTLN